MRQKSPQIGKGGRPAALFFCLLLFVPFLLAWADSWEALRNASLRIETLEARFIQKKTLPILARPLISHGRFVFQAPASLRWEYDDPVRSVLLMHGGVVKRYLRDGGAWREDAGVSLSAMQTVMAEIINWQQGRFDANPHFQATLQSDPYPRVTLVPRDPAVKKMIRLIELSLSREQSGVMKSVRVVEDENSYTLIEFQQVRINRTHPASLFVDVE